MRRVLESVLVILPTALLLLFASGAQASHLHGGRSALRWGGFTPHAPRTHEARLSHLAAAKPAIAGTASIEGTVRDAVTATGIAGIEVCAYTSGPFEEEGEEEEGGAFECSLSTVGGDYSITGLTAGEYIVEFSTPFNGTLDYVTQYYPEAETFEESLPVDIASGQRVSGIDAELSKGGEIEGTVTSGETGAPSGDTLVCAFGQSKGEVTSCGVTAPSGAYTIGGLPTGSYTVVFLTEGPAEYYDQAFSESDATPVKVTAPEGNALNVDAVLPALPKRIVAPRVTGNATVGGTLTCEEGSYSGVPAPTLSVEWLREGEAVAGATSVTYTVQTADAGRQLQCKVTATNLMGWLWVKTAGIPIPVPPTTTAPTTTTPPATPPSPAGGVLPNITVLPLVTAASRVLTSHHRTTIRLKCSGGPCKGTLQLLLRVVSHHHVTTLVLARGSFSLQAGAGSSVVMHLTAAGRSHLPGDAHRAVAAKLKVSLYGGATTMHAVSAT